MKPPRKGTKRAWGACCAAIGCPRPSRARFVPLRGGQSRASAPGLARLIPRQDEGAATAVQFALRKLHVLHQRGQGT